MDGPKSVTATFAIDPVVNLITNGSFESSITGWNGYNKAVLALVTGGQDGVKAVRVTGPTPGVDEFGLNDSPSWIANAGPAGTTYEISAWIRSSSSTSPVRMRIREYMKGVRVGPREYYKIFGPRRPKRQTAGTPAPQLSLFDTDGKPVAIPDDQEMRFTQRLVPGPAV